MYKIVCVGFASVLLVFGRPLLHAQVPTRTPEAEILQIERDACNAYLHADADYLDKLLTEDFSAINGRGEINTKAEELAEVRQRAVRYTTFENRDMQVHLHGDTTVVVGLTTVKGETSEHKAFAIEVRFTDVFTRIDGRWRMLAGHSSRIPSKEG